MITPRRTRLLRVPSLRGLQHGLIDAIRALDPQRAADTAIVVPTRAAGEQLRRTVEDRLLQTQPVLAWPMTGTRADVYRELFARHAPPLEMLPAFDREVILGRVARETASAGLAPPFAIRPALVAEMLALYDHVRRLGRSVDDFDRNLRAELEPAAAIDRGAERLLEQTAFLSAAFRAYEQHLASRGLLDEHSARAAILSRPLARPIRHVIVATGDRAADSAGLWPVDFTLLSALPGLERLDVVATEATLAAGFLERIHDALPDLEEAPGAPGLPHRAPRLAVPGETAAVYQARDREDELVAVARRLKAACREGPAPPLHRHALIVRRPLPYLYLARSVFGSAGVPFEAIDTLPLAAEPFAAALDLMIDAVASGFSRASLLALLRSPHFVFRDEGAALAVEAIDALDRVLAEVRYLGGLDRLTSLAADWTALNPPATREEQRRRRAVPAARAAAMLASELAPLSDPRPVPAQLDVLFTFLTRHHREASGAPDAARTDRVRHAVMGALSALGSASAAHDPGATAGVTELSATIRRWLGAQTFALRTGEAGVRVLDAHAARFADVDDVQLLGLVEGEWPEPVRRNILYPPFLLATLEPASAATDPSRRDRDALAAARAEFHDLLHLAGSRVRVSAFVLESDAIVEPSTLADELPVLALDRDVVPEPRLAVLAEEALTLDTAEALAAAEAGSGHEGAGGGGLPLALTALPGPVIEWARLRLGRPAVHDPRFAGEAGPWTLPRVSVSRVDRYLKCPFQFFASEVLRLEDEPRDEDVPPPWERGRFLHALFEQFFREWQSRGHKGITADRVPEARAVLSELAERALATLTRSEATLERLRLFGSAAGAGIIDRVLSMEAERPDPIDSRLIEYELDSAFAFRQQGGGARTIRLRAKVDRVDLLRGGTFRVIDYKSNTVPDLKRSVQLQVYTSAVAQQLTREGQPYASPAEAFYLSMEGDSPVKALKPARGESLDDVLRAAEERLVEALDGIAAGHFPISPALRSLCGMCPFDQVCRKAYVEAADD